MDKLRRAKEQLKIYERENSYLKDELKKYKEAKEHLVGRLHQTDLRAIGRAKLIKDSSDEAKILQLQIRAMESTIESLHASTSQGRDLLSAEVTAMRTSRDVAQTQKAELVAAFEELCVVFHSFSLKS